MKTVTKFETYDGKIHDTMDDAKRYLDRQYGDNLLKISREIGDKTFDKYPYMTIAEYIDKNLKAFMLLSRIKNDMKLFQESDDLP